MIVAWFFSNPSIQHLIFLPHPQIQQLYPVAGDFEGFGKGISADGACFRYAIQRIKIIEVDDMAPADPEKLTSGQHFLNGAKV